MGEFPFPFGPFPWWYVLGFFVVLAIGGVVLSVRDRLKGAQSAMDYLKNELDKMTDEATKALHGLAKTQQDVESLTSLCSDLIKTGLSKDFDIVVVEHPWEDPPPKPLLTLNEKVVYAERVFAFAARSRTDGKISDVDDALGQIDDKRKIRVLPKERVGFLLCKDTESLLTNDDTFIVKFREEE